MKPDVLVAEIGSTITKVNAFGGLGGDHPVHLGQGISLTTVDTDVTIGFEKALDDMTRRHGLTIVRNPLIIANSSAAGGLKMTVHGLTQDMTARAAKEASLGAGAVINYITSGVISPRDCRLITKIQPNIILLSGGVDYGESQIVLDNALTLRRLALPIPLLYAGNRALQDEISDIFEGSPYHLYLAENVFPSVDHFNILPAKHVIQQIFSHHIIHAKGIGHLQDLCQYPIIPTPLAVLNITEALSLSGLDDILVIDVGGATTDVHSVTDGDPLNRAYLAGPEPRIKRTVEGDLGVYINAENIKTIWEDTLTDDQQDYDLTCLTPLPQSDQEIYLSRRLTQKAVRIAVKRHAGLFLASYSLCDTQNVMIGKDLSAINYIIGTGGALVRLDNGKSILNSIRVRRIKKILLPREHAQTYIDTHYIFSACGCLLSVDENAAVKLAKTSIGCS